MIRPPRLAVVGGVHERDAGAVRGPWPVAIQGPDVAPVRVHDEWPVLYVDLSEDEERLVLASLDPLAAMALLLRGSTFTL